MDLALPKSFLFHPIKNKNYGAPFLEKTTSVDILPYANIGCQTKLPESFFDVDSNGQNSLVGNFAFVT